MPEGAEFGTLLGTNEGSDVGDLLGSDDGPNDGCDEG